ERLRAPAVAAREPSDAGRRGRRRPRGSRGRGEKLGRHGRLRSRRCRVGSWTGNEKAPSAAEGPSGLTLSRRKTCPELAPCRLEAGRLSWLYRAGPPATLDKRSSV